MRLYYLLEKRLEEVIAGVGVVIMCAMVFFQVVMRYVFSLPTSWSDEIAQYCMLWSVYLSVSWAVRERAHIRVMNFINLFPLAIKNGMVVFSDFIWFIFGIFLTWHSITLNISYWKDPYFSPALNIDQKWPYLCLVFGFGLMTLRIVQIYYRWWFHGISILEGTSKEDSLMLDFLRDYAYEMSELSQALTVFFAMVIAIALAVPIPIAVSIGTVIGYFMLDLDFAGIANSMYTGVEPFPLITVPLFVFAGSLMEQGGMARRIVNMAESLIGNVTGSLGLVAVLGCAFFAALSGSGPATTAAIGAVMIPSMIKMRYDPAFGGAIAAAGGALGSLIPPSNLMIIYGIVAEQSIPRLFLAGFIPGILATMVLMITTYIIAKRRNYVGDGIPFSWPRVGDAFYQGIWALIAPIINIRWYIFWNIYTNRSCFSCCCICVYYRLVCL